MASPLRPCPPVLPAAIAAVVLATPRAAEAHASEQGFVLLLPTDLYISAGVAAVALTVVLLSLLPAPALERLFRPRRLTRHSPRRLAPVTSTLAFVLLIWLVHAGLAGPHDPLTNPMPLFIWTVWWIGFVALQALTGDLWAYANPWTGPVALIRRITGLRPCLRLPAGLGQAPAIAGFLGFAYLLLADPAPTDPGRLTRIVAGYWGLTAAGILLFGPRWLTRCEALSLMLRAYARLGVFGRKAGWLCIGLPGWQILHRRAFPIGTAILGVILLGTGSFDGLNETFWWLGLIGVNPLEFPGRSAVIGPNAAGLLIANAGLIAVLAATIALGQRLVAAPRDIGAGFRRFAPSILPIALGYHVAHYLPSFLVDGQWALVALSDPFGTGADYLGLGPHYVTTGLFNTRATVRLIFLAQAGAVVLGHVLAVMLADAIAVRTYGSRRCAALSQAPLAAFMIGYTLFGLWLLASPRM